MTLDTNLDPILTTPIEEVSILETNKGKGLLPFIVRSLKGQFLKAGFEVLETTKETKRGRNGKDGRLIITAVTFVPRDGSEISVGFREHLIEERDLAPFERSTSGYDISIILEEV